MSLSSFLLINEPYFKEEFFWLFLHDLCCDKYYPKLIDNICYVLLASVQDQNNSIVQQVRNRSHEDCNFT
jgi:hypothetical protein